MSTHNIGFYEGLTKVFFNYHQISSNTHLISSSEPYLFNTRSETYSCIRIFIAMIRHVPN